MAEGGVTRRLAKKALEPLVRAGVTAGAAYLTRKGLQLWEEKVQPKIREKGGAQAAARERLETAAEKVGGPASEAVSTVAEKLGVETPAGRSSSDEAGASREEERRRRAQRRQQRRRALEKSGSN